MENTAMGRSAYTMTLSFLMIPSLLYYGIRSTLFFILGIIFCIITDKVCFIFRKKEFTSEDMCRSAETGMLTACMFPAAADTAILIITCIFSIIIGRHLLTQRGKPIFIPCCTGYIVSLVIFGEKVLKCSESGIILPIISDTGMNTEKSLSAIVNSGEIPEIQPIDIISGNFNGSIGSVHIGILIFSAVVLIISRNISPYVFLGIILSAAAGAELYGCSPIFSLISNMLIFSGIYLASDSENAPKHKISAFIMGTAIGFLSFMCSIMPYGTENAIIPIILIMTPFGRILDESADCFFGKKQNLSVRKYENCRYKEKMKV